MAQRAALVTGAAKRLGAALLEELGEAGFALALHYHRSEKAAQELSHKLQQRGFKVALFPCNLLDQKATQSLIPKVAQELGPLTCLVNSASLYQLDRLGQMKAQTIEEHLALHIKAPLWLAESFAQQLPQGESGIIVNMLDQRIDRPRPGALSYGASKAGLAYITEQLALELAPQIRVNAICPGPSLKAEHTSEENYQAYLNTMPLNACPSPEAIRLALAYFLKAKAVTGQRLWVDAGQHLGYLFEKEISLRTRSQTDLKNL